MHKHDCDNCPDRATCPPEAQAGWALLNPCMDWLDANAENETLKEQVLIARPAMMIMHSQAINFEPAFGLTSPKSMQRLINMAFLFGWWYGTNGVNRVLPPVTPIPEAFRKAFGIDEEGRLQP